MKEILKEVIKKLNKEYDRCMKIDDELTKQRSSNYYYHTRAELIKEIIDDLQRIMKEVETK